MEERENSRQEENLTKTKEVNKMKNRFACFCLLCLWVTSCSSDRLFESYQGMEDLNWHMEDTVKFELPTELGKHKNLIGIKYTEEYPFRNLYLRYMLRDSTGKITQNILLDIPLFDSKTGSPLGKGFGSTFTKYDTVPVDVPAAYAKVEMLQYMRVEKLQGIEAVGLKVVSVKN